MNDDQRTRNRAILIAGSPGAGKSTLSAFLARQLTLHQIPARLFHEHDFAQIETMARFRKEWYFGDLNTAASWLEATPLFFGPCTDSGEVWVLDALYPGFFPLLGLYTPSEVAAFADDLAVLLKPVDPLIVHLAGSPRALMQRAVAQRGAPWREEYLRYTQNWHLRGYPGGMISDMDDLLRLFEWREHHSLQLLARWPGDTLVVNAERTPLDEIKHVVLGRVGVDGIVEDAVSPDVLEAYIGDYVPSHPDSAGSLVIELEGDHLRVNAYWDYGCRLLPEGRDTFRLEATEDVITFVTGPDGIAKALRYIHAGRTDPYQKSPPSRHP